MANYFSRFNKEFLFDLPEELLKKPVEERYISIADAVEKYGEGVEIQFIGYGINVNHSERAATSRSAWVATEEEMINVPEHQLPIIEEMMSDPNAVKLTRNGKFGGIIVSYENKWGKNYKFTFCEI